ncbi:MAG: S-layer homology domain-containing protein [Synergistaceae bacterium]|nr:S-layer homology domain-containing protein [Synergistaceae bacterium]
MKKLAVLVAVVSIAALAAPALAATNPFMDVPMNHWAYDAIGQLAAHGILSGYPDGLYKGKQQTTRYEMASALARALAVVDMTKASKQDVEMLKRLVVEFKDELEAPGVKVAELDERVAILEERLGGWHIHGVLALDFTYHKNHEAPVGDSDFTYDDAKLFFERTWGEDDEFFFQARMENSGGSVTTDRFFVEMPFFFDSRLTVGRFAWNWESDYLMSMPQTGGWTGDSVMTNWVTDGFGWTKNFGLGTVKAIFAHPGNGGAYKGILNGKLAHDDNWSAYMLALGFNMQFTEQIGLDLGAQAFFGDNAEQAAPAAVDSYALDKFWTVWAGLRFNFNDNIGFKGIFYHQKDEEDRATSTGWVDADIDDANHWALILDVKQEALKYTSLWLEYGQYDLGYTVRSDKSIFYSTSISDTSAPADMKYWRIALGQEWNDKWATHLFYYGYKVELAGGDWKPAEMGLGVQYKLNDYTTMGLNYVHVKDANRANEDDDDVIRFRTSIEF